MLPIWSGCGERLSTRQAPRMCVSGHPSRASLCSLFSNVAWPPKRVPWQRITVVVCVRRRDAGRTLLSVPEEDSGASPGDPSAAQPALPSALQRQDQQEQLIKETESLQLVNDAAPSIASTSGAAHWRSSAGLRSAPPKRVLMTHSTPSSSGTKRPVWDDDWVADLIDQKMAELKDPGSMTLKRGRPEFGGAADPQVTGATISRPPLSRGPSVRRRTS